MDTAVKDVQKNPLGYEKVGSLLRKYAIPCIIAMLVSALYNIVDQIFIGQGVGVLGNAATNVAFPLSTVCVATALLFGTGCAAKYSLELGAGRREGASEVVGNAMGFLAITGVIIAVLVEVFLQPLMLAFGATPEVLGYAMTYTRITAIGIPFLIFANGTSNIIRADGSPRYSMGFMVTGAVLNTILDPLLMFGFGMGIAGAAIATTFSQVVSCACALWYTTRFKNIRLNRSDFKLKFVNLKEISALGASACFNQLAMLAVQITMNNVLTYYGARSSYGSEIPLACAGIIIKVGMIFLSIVIGIAQGSQPIIGFNYGAKQYGRVRETYKLAILSASVVSVVSFLCFQIFPRQIISLFGSGSAAYFEFAERYFRIFMFGTLVNSVQPVTGNFFTAIGKPAKGIFISMTRQIIFLLPLILLLPMVFGINGIMYAGPIADFAAFAVAMIMVMGEMRRMRKKSETLENAIE